MSRKTYRMTENQLKIILADLDRFAEGELGSKLTWRMLEETSGFSRQALQNHTEVKTAYVYAKKSLSGQLITSRKQAQLDNEDLKRQVAKLTLELAEWNRKEKRWLKRWQRIAYHLRLLGIQLIRVDKAIPS